MNKQSAILSTAVREVIVTVLSFLTGVIVARWLGPQGRGEYAIVILWPSLFATLGSLGLRESLVYYQATGTYRTSDLNTAALVLSMAQSLIFGVLGWGILPILLSDKMYLLSIARFYLLLIPLYLFTSYLQGLLQGKLQLILFNLLRAGITIFYFLAIIFFIIFNALNVFNLTSCMLISLGLVLIISIVNVLIKEGFTMGISLEMFKKLLSFGLRNHVGNISQLLNGRLDQMLMALFLPPIELGWYATAVSVSTLVQVGSSSFAVFLFPKIAQSENFSQQQELVRNNMRVSLTLLLILGILFSLVIPFAIPIIYTFNYIPSIAPAMILILAGICLGVNENLSAGLQGFGKPEALAKAQILGLVITGLLLWILLPIMGIMGAALASLVAYFITLLYLGMVLSRCAEIPMRKLFSPMPFFAFVSLVSAGLKLAFQKYVPFFETNKNK